MANGRKLRGAQGKKGTVTGQGIGEPGAGAQPTQDAVRALQSLPQARVRANPATHGKTISRFAHSEARGVRASLKSYRLTNRN